MIEGLTHGESLGQDCQSLDNLTGFPRMTAADLALRQIPRQLESTTKMINNPITDTPTDLNVQTGGVLAKVMHEASAKLEI